MEPMLDSYTMSQSSSLLFHELKKQASFFVKEKIKTARLALTDVTPVQLMTEEATNGNPWPPDARTMGVISRAAFEVDDYWRIVEILHIRLENFDRRNWRRSYNAMIVLEHLITHGPESAAREFRDEKGSIRKLQFFQHVDEKGFNWGLAVKKKSERLLELLEKGESLKEERQRVRKVTREIQGFGSFSERVSASKQGVVKEIGRSHSWFNEHQEGTRNGSWVRTELTRKREEKEPKSPNLARGSVPSSSCGSEEDQPYSASEKRTGRSYLGCVKKDL